MGILDSLRALWSALSNNPYRRGGTTGEIPSPSNPIDFADVHHDEETQRLTVENIEGPVRFALLAPTNSMEPLDTGHIMVMSSAKKYMDDLNVGDIVIRAGIYHEITEVGRDEQGTFYRTQGWNNNWIDPGIARREDIDSVTLVIVLARAV